MFELWADFSDKQDDSEESERIREMIESLRPIDGDPLSFLYQHTEIKKLIRNMPAPTVEAPTNAAVRRRQQRSNRGKKPRRG